MDLPKVPPAVKENLATSGSGAIAGAMILGPIGALIGAGLGFLFKKKVLDK